MAIIPTILRGGEGGGVPKVGTQSSTHSPGQGPHDATKILTHTKTLSLLRVINVKIPLQPHKKYDITQ